MQTESQTADVTVVGGGLAGICAAIAAARLGSQVNLIQNRGLLGGNSSSEIRVWVAGATKHGINRYARESGIMDELFLENQYRNPDGNPYFWDALLIEKVRAEPNIHLFLNTQIETVTMADPETIHEISGTNFTTETNYTFSSPTFIDATGDGTVAFLAGADFHFGREARSTYNEQLAPEVADDDLLGSSILFYTKDVGHPVKYIKPAFAKDITQTPIVKSRVVQPDGSGCDYWWIEYGGKLNTIKDKEAIRDELWAVVYGIWDYIKNSGKYDADNLTLEWVGSTVGTRESRRFMGPYVLKEKDIEDQTEFPDRVAFGGWSIDIHPAEGMYTEAAGTEDAVPDGVYNIPYRSLYSRNIKNLFLAGRDISVSHVALGTTRVMATCATLGEAVGTAAAYCAQHDLLPNSLYEEAFKDYQQVLLKQDGPVMGLRNQDPLDRAKLATITASHTLSALNTNTPDAEKYGLDQDVAFLFPVDPAVHGFDLRVQAKTASQLTVEAYTTGKPENYIPADLIETFNVPVSSTDQWVNVPLNFTPDTPQNVFIIIRHNPAVSLYRSDSAFQGILSFVNKPVQELLQPKLHHFVRQSPVLEWTNQMIARKNFVFKVADTQAFEPSKLQNGYVRPYGGPNMWATTFNGASETLQYDWTQPQTISQVRLTLNDDLNEDLINLHHHRTPFPVIPELARDFEVLAQDANGQWQSLVHIINNRQRQIILDFDPLTTQALKVRFDATNGSKQLSLFEIRVY
ncbi:FAD-dependent oxidoreductase [Lacticaseibacillus manihotivorans]|uniref:Pyridine nucleotide-disulfide oxidoreductase n=2 Tax=Lacticaseibacillus manihotivorans TaxID=88233 RepID=A0A0R1Q9Z8_9LACO|nr:FAD-dependent oxidoreductase [Lacticaseibacillus manihotivorans]KRL41217.1 pyridine nucleotide-disulfide oxidoreductase [Lacticaseibacillus manihotivorans DSM 13343 = JCM 12514]QFQ90333.1 FAD-dependent oxidoreductase [Lacticaseibacillus manihotivorans]